MSAKANEGTDAAPPPPILDICGVSIRYGAVPILDGASLQIPRAEATAITGKTGGGKSSLLYVIGLLKAPTDGDVVYAPDEGEPALSYAALSQKQKSHILRRDFAFVFQRTELINHWNAETNILLPLISRGVPHQEAARTVADLCASLELDLSDINTRSTARLSGGERQRVGIARALAAAPKIIFADEPFGSLDPDTADKVMKRFFAETARRGITTVIVTHDRQSIKHCSREYRIDGNRISPAA